MPSPYGPFGRAKKEIDLDLQWRDVEPDRCDAKSRRVQAAGATNEGLWFQLSLSETLMGALGKEPTYRLVRNDADTFQHFRERLVNGHALEIPEAGSAGGH